MSQTASHTNILVKQGAASMSVAGFNALYETESSSEKEEGRGRGNSLTGSKAIYARRQSSHVYEDIRDTDHDVNLFEKTVYLSRGEFDALHCLAENELRKPMDVKREHYHVPRVARKKRLSTQEMLFAFLDIMGETNKGGLGVQRVAHKYGVSTGSVSNYFRHVLFALYRGLEVASPALIRWPSAEERAAAEGLVIGFPKCGFFMDGNKNKRWRPKNNREQKRAYDDYNKNHAWAIAVLCDLFGRFIRLTISYKGAESHRNLYTNSEVYKDPAIFLSDGQHGIADMGFAGDGALVVPYERNESTDWMYRVLYKRYIRKQRMVNEWGIGYINNRYRLFLGRWPFEKSLFPISYTLAAVLCNWQFDRRGYALQL